MLDIEYIATDSLQPYEGNAKEHPPEQVQQIMTSIQEFGMNDPIAIWGPENLIIEGHGRWLACTLLGMPKVPVIRLDDLTDEHAELMAHMMLKIKEVAAKEGLENGYRCVINTGEDGQQTVKHLHIHILGKRAMQWPPG